MRGHTVLILYMNNQSFWGAKEGANVMDICAEGKQCYRSYH